jgi:hypothetical protein
VATSDGFTVHADLQPVKGDGAPPGPETLARWFA